MKTLFFSILASFIFNEVNAQIPKNGTYSYDYCDMEYNKCFSKCKVKIEGNKIWIYAPPNLTGIKEGELFESGELYKHESGKWTIIHATEDKLPKKSSDADLFVWIDFKTKQFWTF